MRPVAAIVAISAVLAVPALAQHGAARSAPASHGGFTSHGGFSSHGGFAPSHSFAPRSGFVAPRGFAPRSFAPRGVPRLPSGYSPRFRPPMNRLPYRASGFAPDHYRAPYQGGDRDRGRHRRPYEGGFGLGYAYGYPGWPGYPVVLDPWLFGPDDYDSDNSAASAAVYPDSDQQDYAPEPWPAQQYGPQSAPRPLYAPPAPAERPASAPASEQTVTVIFRDGRAPEKVHNYLLTPSMLTILDGQYRQIPLDQVDIAATEAANRAAGVDFRVPGSPGQ